MAKTTKQIAREAGVSQRTVQRRIKAGKLKAKKPGHDYIVSGPVSAAKNKRKGGKKK